MKTTAIAVATACARSAYTVAKYARTMGGSTQALITFAQESAESAFEDWAQANGLDEETYEDLVIQMCETIKANLE